MRLRPLPSWKYSAKFLFFLFEALHCLIVWHVRAMPSHGFAQFCGRTVHRVLQAGAQSRKPSKNVKQLAVQASQKVACIAMCDPESGKVNFAHLHLSSMQQGKTIGREKFALVMTSFFEDFTVTCI